MVRNIDRTCLSVNVIKMKMWKKDERDEAERKSFFIARGREGEVLGVIDGGVDRMKDGRPEHIESFSVRFIMQCRENKILSQ